MERSEICRYCGGVIRLVPARAVYGSAVKRLGLEKEYNTDLLKRNEEAPQLFGQILMKSDAQLRCEARFYVQKSENGTAWETVTEHCCLGGCDMGVYTFSNERDALLFAALLQAAGYRPPHNIACPACYAEYREGSV